ncbi:MAG: SpoIIE family protein phosphatase [Bacillota bacterium]
MIEKQDKDFLIQDNNFIETVLNSLAANIVVLDIEGKIIKINQNWVDFNLANAGEPGKVSPKVNYLEVCRRSFQAGDETALDAAKGIESVINGTEDLFTMEYPCHSPAAQRWFLMKVTPLKDERPSEVVVFHIDITARRLAEERVKLQSEELARANQEKQDILEKGRKIYQQFLPQKLPEIAGLDIESFYQPAERIGGDFYNIYQIGDKLLFYLADITGHSLDGAIINIFLREAVKNYLLFIDKDQELKPGEITKFIADQYFKEDFPDDYFLSLIIGIYDISERYLELSNSGIHIYPRIIKSNGESIKIECSDLPFSGAIPEDYYREQAVCRLNLESGDLLFLTTDGLVEEENEQGDYGQARLENILKENIELSAERLKEVLVKDHKSFTGKSHGRDDITFLLFKIN